VSAFGDGEAPDWLPVQQAPDCLPPGVTAERPEGVVRQTPRLPRLLLIYRPLKLGDGSDRALDTTTADESDSPSTQHWQPSLALRPLAAALMGNIDRSSVG
jgi:hypothetical protein